MTVFDYDWSAMIADASKCTNPNGPTKLLTLLRNKKNPWLKRDHEQQVALQTAHQTDLGAMYTYRYSGHPLTNIDRAIWVDRLAWLLIELNTCARQRPEFGRLPVILAVARAFSFDKSVWERLPTTYLSDNLFVYMSAFVGSTECSFTSRGQTEPIWERETVDRFQSADEAEDWVALEADWITVSGAFPPDPDLHEAIACLCVDHRGRHALAMAFDHFKTIFQVMNAASAMSSEQKVIVAPLLSSSRARFGIVQSLAFDHPCNQKLSGAANEELSSLFRNIQSDSKEWRKWMKALNRYPVRSKMLQPAFGLSLVDSTSEAKSAYVDAIHFDTFHSDGRSSVTECLMSFKENANLCERKQLWHIAFQKWSDWSFGESNGDQSLASTALSPVDYGIIGYFIENLSEKEHEAAMKQAYSEMMRVSDTWHIDFMHFISAWNRLLSKWQIIQYAYQVRMGEKEWALQFTARLPFDPNKDHYNAMTFPFNKPPSF